jgi:hypothetical protein
MARNGVRRRDGAHVAAAHVDELEVHAGRVEAEGQLGDEGDLRVRSSHPASGLGHLAP